MEFTTHLELHSQTTRLLESTLQRDGHLTIYGVLTLYDVLFQGTYARAAAKVAIFKLQLGRIINTPDFKFELLPLRSPLLGQSRLVSFPPLIDMLKFSGYSYLI
jgi:hypothetical protein